MKLHCYPVNMEKTARFNKTGRLDKAVQIFGISSHEPQTICLLQRCSVTVQTYVIVLCR